MVAITIVYSCNNYTYFIFICSPLVLAELNGYKKGYKYDIIGL